MDTETARRIVQDQTSFPIYFDLKQEAQKTLQVEDMVTKEDDDYWNDLRLDK